MAGKLIALAAILLALAVSATQGIVQVRRGPVIISGRSTFGNNSNVVEKLQNTITLLPVTLTVDKALSPEVMKKIMEANSTTEVAKQLQVNGQDIEVPKVKSEKDSKKVSQAMGSFADTLKSVTDEETCDCDPKDSANAVKALIEATSNLSQDLLRCLLNSLKSVIKPREATLIRTIVKESMGALSRSVDGIYTIWKIDTQKRDLASVQAVVDGLMGVLNKFSSRLATAMMSDQKSRVETVTFVVDTLVNMVANTSEAIAKDVDSGLSEEQLVQVMSLAKDLAEPLTSQVLAEFVQGTARIPYINKLLLAYITESQTLSRDCAHSRAARAAMPRAVLKALSDGLRAMNIKVASSDPSKAASSSHRVATTNFLLSLIKQNEDRLQAVGKDARVGDKCRERVGESLTNIGAIVKSIIDTATPDIKDPKNKQQTGLASTLSKDFIDILSVIGSNMARPGSNTPVANITNMIYQQYEVIRRVAKNDQAISRDSSEGIKSTISLLVDIARLEIKFVQVSIGRVRDSKDSTLRFKSVRDVNLRIIKSAVNAGRSVAPADNKPLSDLIKGSGDALAEVINELEGLFAKRPQTFGDVLYEVFYSILETQRKLVTSAASPSRSGLPTTVPSDVIFGLANAVRTAIDWTNALTRSSGMDKNIQQTLIRFVIDISTNVQESWTTEEKDNKNIDDSVRSDLKDVTDELNKILKSIQTGVTTTTAAANDYNDYSDDTPTSGISQIGSLINKLDEVLQYVLEGRLKPKSSIVTRNSEVVIHIISVIFDDVSRTPHVNEDGSVELPSGTIKPCGRDGDKPNTNPGGMTTTPLPSSPETKPPQTTTEKPSTALPTRRPGQQTSTSSSSSSTGRPGRPTTGRPGSSTTESGSSSSTDRPGSSSTGRPSSSSSSRPGRPSTGRPGSSTTSGSGSSTTTGSASPSSTGRPGSPSTGRPGSPSTGRPGRPSTGRPGSSSTGKPGSPSTTKPGESPSTGRPGRPSTGRPGSPSTGRPGRPSTGRPGSPSTGRPGSPSTGRPGSPSTGRPGSPSTTKPGESPNTGRPGRPSTGRPGSPSTGKPGSPSTTRPGSPSTGRPGRPSTGRPGSPSTGRPGRPSTGRPGSPSTGKPGSPSTTRPGSPSTGRPGRPSTGRPGSPSTGRPGSPSTGRPGAPSTGRPGSPSTGRPGRPSTGRPGSPSTGRPGSPSTGRPGRPSTGRPGSPSTGRPGRPSTGRPGSPSTGKPGAPVTVGPGVTVRGGPGKFTTGKPGSPSTGGPRDGDSNNSGVCETDQIKKYLKKTGLSNDDLQKLIKDIQELVNKTASKDCKHDKKVISPAVTKRITNDVLKSLSVERSLFCKA